MAMPQCCYLAKGAKRPSHTTNTIKFDRIPFDSCNSIKRFDLSPFDQKISTYLQPPAKNICRNVSYEMWGISGVCTLDLTVAKTSSHYDRFAISVPARSLLLFDLASQDGNIGGPKGPRGTRGNGDISEARFMLCIIPTLMVLSFFYKIPEFYKLVFYKLDLFSL